jgi:hypothetical protein
MALAAGGAGLGQVAGTGSRYALRAIRTMLERAVEEGDLAPANH